MQVCRYVQVLSGTCDTEESLISTICRSFLAAPKCHLSPSRQQLWAPQHVLKFPQKGMSTQWYYTDYTLLNHQSLETPSEGQDEHGKSFQWCNISIFWQDLANIVTSFSSTLTRDSSWVIVLKLTLLCIARMDPYAVLGVEAVRWGVLKLFERLKVEMLLVSVSLVRSRSQPPKQKSPRPGLRNSWSFYLVHRSEMILGGMVFVTLGYEFVSSSSCIAHSSFHILPENTCEVHTYFILKLHTLG